IEQLVRYLVCCALAGQLAKLVGNKMPLTRIEPTRDSLKKDQIEQPLLPCTDEDLRADVRQQREGAACYCLGFTPVPLPCRPALGENLLDILHLELDRPRHR